MNFLLTVKGECRLKKMVEEHLLFLVTGCTFYESVGRWLLSGYSSEGSVLFTAT